MGISHMYRSHDAKLHSQAEKCHFFMKFGLLIENILPCGVCKNSMKYEVYIFYNDKRQLLYLDFL